MRRSSYSTTITLILELAHSAASCHAWGVQANSKHSLSCFFLLGAAGASYKKLDAHAFNVFDSLGVLLGQVQFEQPQAFCG